MSSRNSLSADTFSHASSTSSSTSSSSFRRKVDSPATKSSPRQTSSHHHHHHHDMLPTRNRAVTAFPCGLSKVPLPPPSPPGTIHSQTTTRSRKWGARLSSLIPMLTSSSSSSSNLGSDRLPPSRSQSTLTLGRPSPPTETQPHPPPLPHESYHSKQPSPLTLSLPFHTTLDTPATTTTTAAAAATAAAANSDRASSPSSFFPSDLFCASGAIDQPPPPPPPPAPTIHRSSPSAPALAPKLSLPKSATMPILSATDSSPDFDFDHQDAETRRRTANLTPHLALQQSPPQIKNSPRQANTDDDDDASIPKLRAATRKLRKSSVSPIRGRANTYHTPSLTPVPSVRSATLPVPNLPRGRIPVSQSLLSVADSAAFHPPPSSSLRPQSRASAPKATSPTRGRVRKSWMPRGRSRSSSVTSPRSKMQAWILSEEPITEYNSTLLQNAQKVPELWNENGNVLVYLYPRGSGSGPSFKVPDFIISSSYLFNELLASESSSSSALTTPNRSRNYNATDNLLADDASPMHSLPPPDDDSSSAQLKLYIPAARPSASTHLVAPGQGGDDELNRLIAIRNLFAFLTGQPLVGTKLKPTVFDAFLEIADLLGEYTFAAIDGPGFGDAVDLSFGFYSQHLGLSDCRHSREMTVQALILGERMRNTSLYNEAFAHAAGKYSAIMDLRLAIYDKLSPTTRQRLERAHIDLVNRQHNVNEYLEQFEFPSIFAGIANSTSSAQLRTVRFKVWRNSFARMRSFMLGYYKSAFGSWPPKASSKKNPFMESGLNRLVLKLLYSDMCALYDLLVDRSDLTTRVIDHVAELSSDSEQGTKSVIRNIESEYDRSRPPVLPPIPFDLPQLPCVSSIHKPYSALSAKSRAKFDKKLKEHELLLILSKAYNPDINIIQLPFLDHFKEFEAREAKGKIKQDLVDQRIGYWIFLYAVLQSLPMLVVDAPGLQYTEGTEYFLCQPPIGQPPWAEDGQVRKMWYEVTGGGGLVELSADAVMYSVEGTYHRSHCWLAAKQWEGMEGGYDGIDAPAPDDSLMSPLEPPRANFQGQGDGVLGSPASSNLSRSHTPVSPLGTPPLAVRSRNASPSRIRASSAFRSSIAIGLEPVPMDPPHGVFGGGGGGPHQRSSSLGPRPRSAYVGAFGGSRIVSSSSNLVGMGASPRAAAAAAAAAAGGMTPRSMTPSTFANSGTTTFDDILGGGIDSIKENGETKNRENQKDKNKIKKPMAKKKGFFFKDF